MSEIPSFLFLHFTEPDSVVVFLMLVSVGLGFCVMSSLNQSYCLKLTDHSFHDSSRLTAVTYRRNFVQTD